MKIDARIFPTILIGLDILAAIFYFADGGLIQWRKIIYWLSAAILTFCVTW